MAATSGPSSRDVSPPLGPTPGLTFKRENLQPSLGMGDTAMRPSATGNTNSPRPVVPASEHGIIAGGREKGLSSRDMGQNIQSSQNRKRSSVDSEEYPRRRAAIACEVCRSRKSRCDGSRPKCRLCVELNADCIYREPGVKLDAGDKLILDQLSRIENLLQAALPTGAGAASRSSHILSTGSSAMPNTNISEDVLWNSNNTSVSDLGLHNLNLLPTGVGTWNNLPSVSKTHNAPAGFVQLLQWPKISELLSRAYNPQVILQLELARPQLQFNPSLTVDLSDTASYIEAFFERANVWYACVNPYTWATYYRTALSQGFRSGAESCIVLLVLALGCASTHGSISRLPHDTNLPGMSYFSAAWGLLPSLMTHITILSAQCMILTAAYLFYITRPLEAWTLLSTISTKIQLLLTTTPSTMLQNTSRELCERIYWNARLFESDLQVEMDLPRSGLISFEETVGLPCGFEEVTDESGPAGRDDLWYLVAKVSLHRLLNRVRNVLYSKGAPTDIHTLVPITTELDYQLGQWFDGLPLPVQFPRSRILLQNPVQTALRLRYFACRATIFRPYILAVLENEALGMDSSVRENCRIALESCMRQLEQVTEHHACHITCLWQGALSIVLQSLFVMGATMSPSLASLLPPPEQMDVIFQQVIEEVQHYTHLAPSLRLGAEILREAEDRRQILMRNSGMRP